MNLSLAEEVLSHLHNWFVRDSFVLTSFSFSEDGVPDGIASRIPNGVFYRVQGSYINDGLHRMGEPTDTFQTEDVERAKISILSIPKALLSIIDEIEAWENQYGEVAQGPFFSEEFGGYKYEIRGYSSYGAASSNMSGWRLAFNNRLNPWRRMYD